MSSTTLSSQLVLTAMFVASICFLSFAASFAEGPQAASVNPPITTTR